MRGEAAMELSHYCMFTFHCFVWSFMLCIHSKTLRCGANCWFLHNSWSSAVFEGVWVSLVHVGFQFFFKQFNVWLVSDFLVQRNYENYRISSSKRSSPLEICRFGFEVLQGSKSISHFVQWIVRNAEFHSFAVDLIPARRMRLTLLPLHDSLLLALGTVGRLWLSR